MLSDFMASFYPYPGLELVFSRLAVAAHFHAPHQLLSSCRAHGGLRGDMACVCNHQACEPVGHEAYLPDKACSDPAFYHALVCKTHSLPTATALLTTAANIQCAGTAQEMDNGLLAYALCTAGVEGNAGRAGDAAAYRETENGIEMLHDAPAERARALKPGTINIMCFINHSLTPGAMLEAAILATEAKASVLQELSIPSLYSSSIATGTGTDQLAVACPSAGKPVTDAAIKDECDILSDSGLKGGNVDKPLTNAGKHSKLGEMLGLAVRRALYSSLARQNNITPASCCNIGHLLARFGFNEEEFLRSAGSFILPEQAALLRANFQCVFMDPAAVSALAALLHVRDQALWGVLPAQTLAEMELTHAALMAASICGQTDKFHTFRQKMEQYGSAGGPEDVVRLAAMALALGFASKWPDLP